MKYSISFGRSMNTVVIGSLILGPVLTAIIFGPAFLPNPLQIDMQEALKAPSAIHPLGTDALGRDLLSRLCHGGKYSVGISLAALAGSLIIGCGMGLLAGWLGGWIESAVERLVEVILCIPGIILALVIVVFLGRGPLSIIIALTLTGAVYLARLVCAQVKLYKNRGFIEAATISGIARWRLIIFHLIPNIMGPILGYSLVLIGSNILSESSLSFLGMGVQPPEPSWGAMLFEARNAIASAPWLAIAPGAAIFLLVLGLNLVGDGLRDFADSWSGRR